MAPGKKKKKGKKSVGKHGHFVHQKKRVFRASEPLLSVFMWGINHSVAELNHVNIPQLLLPDDFRAFTKIRIENHLYNKDVFPGKYKFKSYCPLVFHDLRKRFGVDEVAFMNSLTQFEPLPTDSPSRSGAKFYVSHDKKFIMKTILSEEVALFHQIIVHYHQFIVESEGKTLLPQYLGMYRVTVSGAEIYIVVMRNILSSSLPIHKKYDLKGSTYTRSASHKEKAKDLPTFKDNDFTGDGMKLTVGDQNRQIILDRLQADINFLAEQKLMDYSLLVGIHDANRHFHDSKQREPAEEEGEFTGGSGEETADEEASGEEPCPETEAVSTPNVAFAVPRWLRPPNAIVVADSKEEKCAAAADFYPVVNRSIDYYAFSQNALVPASTAEKDADGSDGAAMSTPSQKNPEAAAASEEAASVPSVAAAAAAATPGGTSASGGANMVYYLGLIDVLTHYGPRKMAAHTAKTVKHRADEISTINPKAYAQRFLQFVEGHVM